MNYTDDNRGVIQHKDRARQIINYSGIRYDNITPTDIDGFFEKANETFVFCEMKYGDADMPRGQKVALERLVNALRTANKKAVLFLCRHDVANVKNDICAKDAVVDEIFYNGKWHKGDGRTLKQMCDSFMRTSSEAR